MLHKRSLRTTICEKGLAKYSSVYFFTDCLSIALLRERKVTGISNAVNPEEAWNTLIGESVFKRPHCSVRDEIFYREVSLQSPHYSFVVVNANDSPTLTNYNIPEFHVKKVVKLYLGQFSLQ